MPSSRWKGVELAIAKIFGCKRRGPDFRGPSGGNDDLVHPHYSVEVKHLARPTYGQMFAACKQAEQAAHGREPVAVVHKKGSEIKDSLVVMRLEQFKEWRLSGPSEEFLSLVRTVVDQDIRILKALEPND